MSWFSPDRPANTEDCPSHHGLVMHTTDSAEYTCDVCGSMQSSGTVMHGCRQCDFDVCGLCRNRSSGNSSITDDWHIHQHRLFADNQRHSGDVPRRHAWFPLGEAVFHGRGAIAEALVAAGADPNEICTVPTDVPGALKNSENTAVFGFPVNELDPPVRVADEVWDTPDPSFMQGFMKESGRGKMCGKRQVEQFPLAHVYFCRKIFTTYDAICNRMVPHFCGPNLLCKSCAALNKTFTTAPPCCFRVSSTSSSSSAEPAWAGKEAHGFCKQCR